MIRNKHIRILIILSMLCIGYAASAEKAQLLQNGYDYDVLIDEAVIGTRYLLLCIDGDTRSVQQTDILQNAKLLFACQVLANNSSFSFGGIIPKELKQASLFVIDSAGNQIYVGMLNPSLLKGDVTGDGTLASDDSQELLNYLAACTQLSIFAIEASDMDDSGMIDVSDFLCLEGLLQTESD